MAACRRAHIGWERVMPLAEVEGERSNRGDALFFLFGVRGSGPTAVRPQRAWLLARLHTVQAFPTQFTPFVCVCIHVKTSRGSGDVFAGSI